MEIHYTKSICVMYKYSKLYMIYHKIMTLSTNTFEIANTMNRSRRSERPAYSTVRFRNSPPIPYKILVP